MFRRAGTICIVFLAAKGLLACDAGDGTWGALGGGGAHAGGTPGDDGGSTGATGDGGSGWLPGYDGGSLPTDDAGRTLLDGGVVSLDAGGGGVDASGPTDDAGGGGYDGGAGCYWEPYNATASLADLASAYSASSWLAPSLEAMNRRYATGHFVLNAEQNDSQLPGFADPSSWPNFMESLMTMVHEESHGWDFDNAQGSTHPYVMRDDLIVTVPPITTWPRSEILPLITDSATSAYDQTYLTGEQGTYDAVFLFEELNAYTNGGAAIMTVGDQITQQISGRDGVVAHLYYLELYLYQGRTAHPAEYAAMQADPSWMKLVRYAWARGFFWDAQAKPNPLLDIGSEAIWVHVNDPKNWVEIQNFTGQDGAVVACSP